MAIADAELGLPAGLAAQVIAKVLGADHQDPDSEIGKLLQRNAGAFHAPAVPEYADWSGIHIPAMRSATACFCAAGLFDDADGDLLVAAIERSKRTRMPGGRGLQVLEELERNLQAKRAA